MKINYYISSAIESILKNSFMSIASIITVASCILIFIITYCVGINIDSILEHFESSIGFTIHFDDDIEESDMTYLYNKISLVENIKSIDYMDKDRVLEDARNSFDVDERILDGLENDNPLRRAFKVEINNINFQNNILNDVENIIIDYKKDFELKNADNLKDYTHLIDVDHIDTKPLSDFNRIIRIVSSIIILLVGINSIVIITNTIKITVNNRKREINIMKYVGATDWFIRWPFIIEGILIGLFGALAAVILGYFGYARISNNEFTENAILKFLGIGSNAINTNEIFAFLAPVSLFLGMLIGVVGSISSIRKHLNV